MTAPAPSPSVDVVPLVSQLACRQPPLVRRSASREGGRARDRHSRFGRLVELDVGVTQPDVSEGEARITAQRLMKRAGGFDPDVGVQVSESLIVKVLRLGGFRRDRIMGTANAGAQGHGALEQFLRHHWNAVARMLRIQN